MSRRLLPPLALLALGWAAIVWVEPFSADTISDLFLYHGFADAVIHGDVPYRDVFLEYPPLAAPMMALPGLVTLDGSDFRLVYAAWTLIQAGIVMLLCGALAGRTGGSRSLALWGVAAMPFLCGALLRTHFDLAPVALTLLALLVVLRGRPRLGLTVLGLAIMTKGFPAVVVPVMLAWVSTTRGRKVAVESCLALIATAGAIAMLAVAASPEGA